MLRWMRGFLIAALVGIGPRAVLAQGSPERAQWMLTACVKESHRDRLLGREGSGSRRLMLVGDSHMDRSVANRFAEAIQKTWVIPDWVGRTTTYQQVAPRHVRSGTAMRLGPAGEGLQRELRPGEMMFGGTVENDIAILATIGPMASATAEVVFTQFLVDVADGPYAAYQPGPANWYDGRDLIARPIMYWDGTGSNTVGTFRWWAHRGQGTTPSPQLFAHGSATEQVYAPPFAGVVGPRLGAANLSVAGEPTAGISGKHFVTIGSQFALSDPQGVPLPGFALDTFAPFGWDTVDHARLVGPGRHYIDERAIEYLRATRLRPDERMTVMILLGHEDFVWHESRMRQVIDRWRRLCAEAEYDDPHFILVHPWAIAGISIERQRAHAEMYQRLADEIPDVSFISIAEATAYRIYDGNHGLPNLLDIWGLHWGNEEAVYFFGRIMWGLLTENNRCAACYADCDPSTGRGVLDMFDFICFQSAFTMNDPYACDCDTTTGTNPPVCDVFDFICFAQAFIEGCR